MANPTKHEHAERVSATIVRQSGHCDGMTGKHDCTYCPGSGTVDRWCEDSSRPVYSRKAAKAHQWLVANSQRTDIDTLIKESADGNT